MKQTDTFIVAVTFLLELQWFWAIIATLFHSVGFVQCSHASNRFPGWSREQRKVGMPHGSVSTDYFLAYSADVLREMAWAWHCAGVDLEMSFFASPSACPSCRGSEGLDGNSKRELAQQVSLDITRAERQTYLKTVLLYVPLPSFIGSYLRKTRIYTKESKIYGIVIGICSCQTLTRQNVCASAFPSHFAETKLCQDKKPESNKYGNVLHSWARIKQAM